MNKDDEVLVLQLALKILTEKFDAFIFACMDENGNPKTPTRRELAVARGCLPVWCSKAFKKEVE